MFSKLRLGLLTSRQCTKVHDGILSLPVLNNAKRDIHTDNGGREIKKKYSVGLFGCGRIAGVHLKNILRNRRLDLKWIVEQDRDRLQEVKEQFVLGDEIQFYKPSDRDQLLSDKSLDAVIVVSPTNTHTEYICESLKKGKSVFTEKPAGESVSDIRKCYETAEENGLTLVTGYTRRFDAEFCDVKNALDNGSLGKLQCIKTTTRDSPKPSYTFLKSADSTGCNILADLGVHDIDMIVWLTKAKKPESIFINCHVHDDELKDCGEPDSLVGMIKYPDGTLVTMDVFRESCYGYDIRLEAFGTKGMALAENPRESATVIDGVSGGRSRRIFNSFPQRFEAPFEAELEHFVDCLDGKAVPLITKDESLQVAEIIEKGVQSYKEKRLVMF
ncbi:myo-inositol 2-dehydrogenase-like isoform X1 [Ruditapes philippinarum]|uniref:myo-inositol 2-dehydrogenase-like isoform X1 n=1 Tax=Ruditapes philippinarum TaxID=129788 RepID=UPI00295B7A28|nr:myo-inositol 2-dehydrogenase-like isoform X1 [Ruditapes philippinarum]